uniref:Retrovirus-related Pol polyprotein from transposon TNT 1-94-like beta-barrel domain-containing protein n=1 Tax=Manihot esculenta TaxID=3983 RepID=A0A2C9VMS6_MANES
MGNDHPCKVVGINTIKIRMYDGVIRTLTNIRYVPNMRNNLISLPVLNNLGCKFSSEGGILKVMKGALIVMKANQIGRLYVLQGLTIIGSAAVSSSMSNLNVT